MWFSHKEERTSLFLTLSVSALINKNRRDRWVLWERGWGLAWNVLFLCNCLCLLFFFSQTNCKKMRAQWRRECRHFVWWCVDVPEKWISLSHRAAAGVDGSFSHSLAACSTLIIKRCSSQSPGLVRVGLFSLLLSTKQLTLLLSCILTSPSPLSCWVNHSVCVCVCTVLKCTIRLPDNNCSINVFISFQYFSSYQLQISTMLGSSEWLKRDKKKLMLRVYLPFIM